MSHWSRRAVLRFSAKLAACVMAGFLLAQGLAGTAAHAQSFEDLRARGVLGERYDGLVVVRQASPEANRIAAEVNTKRQALYRQRAAEQGVTPDQVGRVYARGIFEGAAKGTWFLIEQGRWVQK